MHFGTGPTSTATDLDPYILDEHLSEIEICSRVSKSVFFLVSMHFVESFCAIKMWGNFYHHKKKFTFKWHVKKIIELDKKKNALALSDNYVLHSLFPISMKKNPHKKKFECWAIARTLFYQKKVISFDLFEVRRMEFMNGKKNINGKIIHLNFLSTFSFGMF